MSCRHLKGYRNRSTRILASGKAHVIETCGYCGKHRVALQTQVDGKWQGEFGAWQSFKVVGGL